MNRRNFINTAITTAGVVAGLDAAAGSAEAPFQFENKLSLKVLGTNWGFPGTTDAFCAAIKKEGMMELKCGGQDRRKSRRNFLTL
jgi:hypothetical protein